MGRCRGAALDGRHRGRALTQAGLDEVEWAVEPARSGTPTLRLAGRFVHSRIDPEGDAERHARRIERERTAQQAGLVVLVGTGLGHLPAALARHARAPLLAWEPFPRLRAALPATRTGASRASVHEVEDPDAFERALAELARPGLRPQLVVHPGYEEVARFEIRFAARALRQRLLGERPLAVERAIVSRRAIEALERLPYRATIEDLGACLEGRTAIVVAAGPTLEQACGALARRRGGVVIAALQALPVLVRAGVRVDFAVAPDPLRVDPAHLAGVGDHVGALLADTSIEPELIDWRPERTFLFHLRSPQLHQVVWESCALPVVDEPLLTVAETSVVLARRLGARRLVLVGMDFRSEDPRYPVRFRSRDRSGRPAWTNSHYFHAARYLDALCSRLAASGCEIARVGEGLPIHAARSLAPDALRAWLAAETPFRIPAIEWHGARQRWERTRALLDAAARGAAGTESSAAAIVRGDPRWAVFDPLPLHEQRRACRAALERLARAPSAPPASARAV